MYDFEDDDNTHKWVAAEPAVRYRKAHEGITKSEFLAIVAYSGLKLTEFSALLPVSKRTIEKVKDEELLSVAVSDRVLQIEDLYHFGSEVLGTRKAFKEWLHTPILALGGESPLSYIDTETGLGIVKDTLGRIAYGVYS